jgi:hypothetical protein
MYILGAGLAGCIAGALEKKAVIFEHSPEGRTAHRAVLRFRESKIATALGIPFRKVMVRKGLVKDGRIFNVCNVQNANQYSLKVLGRVEDRSIWNLAPVERYIAPDDLHEQLVAMCHGRIEFNTPVLSLSASSLNGKRRSDIPVVSTIPIFALANLLGESVDSPGYANIWVKRYAFADCDVHQTLYFPGAETNVYRATLTGGILILEGVARIIDKDIDYVTEAFGLSWRPRVYIECVRQEYGKINPLADDVRKNTLLLFTLKHNVYSLGRFATWRNILLDDVYDDFHKIRGMISLGHYDLMRSIV